MKRRTLFLPIVTALVLSLAAFAAPAGAAGDTAAIQAVIQKANQEQSQALAQGNPALMRDTATNAYYVELVQTNQNLAADGATAIDLVNLSWGNIALTGSNRATANTDETWRTTFADGSSQSSTDRNVYSLIQQGGVWKIRGDAHPNSQVDIPAPGQPGSPGGHQGSLNWSGYEATGGTFTAVNGTWTVPQVSVGSPGADAAWVGIGGVTSRDLIQAGTEETVLPSGQASYQAWIEKLPQVSRPVPLTVNPGDSVSVSIAQQSHGQWQVSIKDNTTGQSYQQAVAYNSSSSSAEWIEEAPTSRRGLVPLSNFGTVSFSGASAIENGQTVNIAQAGGQPITMINSAGQPIATPSSLASNGSSFSVTRSTAQQVSTAPGFVTIPALPFGAGGLPGISISLFGD